MGRVYSPEAVDAGHVPKAHEFQPAAKMLLELLDGTHLQEDADVPKLHGALVLGSVALGRPDRRSDINVIIAYRGDKGPSEAITYYQSIFDEIDTNFHTPIEPSIYHHAELLGGRHTIDPLEMLHLKQVPKEWHVGKNPVKAVHDNRLTYYTAVSQYAAQLRSMFSDALLMTDREIDYRVFHHALDVPIALGRKCLQVLGAQGVVEQGEYANASKKAIIRALGDVIVMPDLRELIIRQTALDRMYTMQLDEVVTGGMPLSGYEQWLSRNYAPAVRSAVDISYHLPSFVGESVE
jgi:hypothetical protein